MNENPDKIKVSNPERIRRVLQRVAEGGLSLHIRTLQQVDTAVKGRAVARTLADIGQTFSISGISERGRAHLASTSQGGVQIEFVLMSTKIVFFSRVLEIIGSEIKVSIPDYLVSMERRKDARFPVTVNTRAYVQLSNWHPDLKDLTVQPFLEYQRDIASLQHVGDLSQGGLSLVSRFPAMCRFLQRGAVLEKCNLMLPLTEPIPMVAEIRWSKRLRESIQDSNSGIPRMARIYKFGLQFINPSERLQSELQKFMARLVVADAI